MSLSGAWFSRLKFFNIFTSKQHQMLISNKLLPIRLSYVNQLLNQYELSDKDSMKHLEDIGLTYANAIIIIIISGFYKALFQALRA